MTVNVLLVFTLAIIAVAILVAWARRYRAYGLAIVPSRRRLGTARVESRLAAIHDVAPDQVTLTFESSDGDRETQTVAVHLDNRPLALETLERWRDDRTPLAVTTWGQRLIRLGRLDGRGGLTLRRATT